MINDMINSLFGFQYGKKVTKGGKKSVSEVVLSLVRNATWDSPPMVGVPCSISFGRVNSGAEPTSVTFQYESSPDVWTDIPGAGVDYVPTIDYLWVRLRVVVTWSNSVNTIQSLVPSPAKVVPLPNRSTMPFMFPTTVYQDVAETIPVSAAGQVVRSVADPNGGMSRSNASSNVTWGSLGSIYMDGSGGVLASLNRTQVKDDVARIFVAERGGVNVRTTMFHTHNASLASDGIEIEAENSERIRLFNNGSTDTLITSGGAFPIGRLSAHIFMQSTSNFGRRLYSDGVMVTDNTASPPSGDVLHEYLGADAGVSFPFIGKIFHEVEYSSSQVDFSDEDQVAAIVEHAYAVRDAILGQQIVIDFPVQGAVLQRQSSSGGGIIQVRGTCNAKRALGGVEARWGAEPWQDCIVEGDTFSLAYTSPNDGTNTLEVRYKSEAHTATVDTISIGHVYGGTGQSNMYGGADFFQDRSSNSPYVSIYERRISNSAALYSGASNDGWNLAIAKAFAPNFLADRANRVGIPCAMVRCSRGGTQIDFWAPDAAVNFDSTNAFEACVETMIKSQGYDPETYNPETDPKLCEFWMQQIGESDAGSGEPRVTYKEKVLEFARTLYARTGAPTYLSVVQELPDFYTTQQRIDDVQDGANDAFIEEAATAASEGRPITLYKGADFEGYDLLAEGSSDGSHWDSDALIQDLADMWQAAVPDERL